MNFLRHLNQIVSFNKRDPYKVLNPDFSETPPLNYSFDFMGYGSMNFLENLGLVALDEVGYCCSSPTPDRIVLR